MKYLAYLLASAAATSAAVLPRQTVPGTDGDFELTDLYIGGGRFSISNFYRFNILEPVSQASASCAYSTGLTGDGLTAFDYTPCSDPSFSFAFLRADGVLPGWSLQITHDSADQYVNQTACVFLSDDRVMRTDEENPNAEYTYMDTSDISTVAWVYKGSDQCSYTKPPQ